jgi:hypothetical protein
VAEDIVRVLRIVEYVGPRDRIEKQIANSLHGTKTWNDIQISAATIGEFPEILERANTESVEERAKRFAASPLGQAMKAEKAAEAYGKQSDAMLGMLGKDDPSHD